MDKQKKQSVIPIYAVGLVWLSRAISGNLSSFGQIIKTVILSVVTYGVLRIFFPDKIKQADPEKPAQQPDAPKQAQTQKNAAAAGREKAGRAVYRKRRVGRGFEAGCGVG